MLISLFLIVVALVLLRIRGHSRWLVWVLLAAILILTVLSGLQIGLGQITGEGVNGAVFYHLRTGLAGGDISQYGWVIAAGLLAPTVIAGGLWRARRWIRPGSNTVARGWDAGIALLIFAAIAIHPVPRASAAYAMRFSSVDQRVEGYHQPALDPAGPESPKNLVVIYLESLERTYMDDTRFPGLTPNLSELEKRAVTFTDLGQTEGATFTIGGMVATQCGVPLILAGGENSMRVSQFLSGANCMGDILSEAGYILSYLGGASTEFAGKGAFYETHSYDEVTGLEQLRPTLADPAYLSEWGVQDDTLFDLARDRFDRLAASDQPFVLTLLTLDTHHPNGHADTNRICKEMPYSDGSNPVLNAVLCDDYLAGQFIEEILSGPHADETVIAIMSDHLAMVNTAADQLRAGPRRNLLMIIDPDREHQVVDRAGTTLDTGPTLMNMLGFDVPLMGLGADLLGDQPTVPERLGINVENTVALANHVMGYQAIYRRLWAYPDISDGLYVNLEGNKAQFGHSAFRMPVLLEFNESNVITKAALGENGAQKTLTEALIDLPEGSRYMWVDSCNSLGLLDATQDASRLPDICAMTGERGKGAALRSFARSEFIDSAQLAEMLSVGPVDGGDADALTLIGQTRGDLPLTMGLPGLSTGDKGVLLQSSSFGSGASLVRRQTTDNLRSGEDWALRRGINLIGFYPDGRTEELDRLDQCASDFDASTHGNWRDQIQQSRGQFIAHAIIVHDTAFCGSSFDVVASPLEGLDLPELRASTMREAYVAVVPESGAPVEFPNRVLPRVRLFLDPRVDGVKPTLALSAMSSRSEPTTAPTPAPTPAPVAAEPSATGAAAPVATEPVALAVPAEGTACFVPENGTSSQPTRALQIGETSAGAAMVGPVGFAAGWWGQEPSGRWTGLRVAEFAVILPETATGLALQFELASPLAQSLTLSFNGEELASEDISGAALFSAEVGSLPRGVPVSLILTTRGPDLTCPAARGASTDARQMAFMLRSLSLSETDTPVVPVLSSAQAAAKAPSDAPCQAVSGLEPTLTARSELPMERAIPVADAIADGAIGLGEGWWTPEPFGVWMGSNKARLQIMLPEASGPLSLRISTAAFGADSVGAVLTFDGQELTRQNTGVLSPISADVTELPRGEVLNLTLTISGQELGCPALNDGGSDTRSLSLMVQSIELTRGVNAPFTNAIAHGGGRLGGTVISDSFDALSANIGRFEVFEIDFNWTTDGDLVCIHDWEGAFTSRFGTDVSAPVDHDTFVQLLAKSQDKPRNCDLGGLAGWLRANPSVTIVTDVKENAVAAHQLIASHHPDLLGQFVPQAYQPEEVTLFRDMGFDRVIWTLYRFGSKPERVIREAITVAPTAITMPQEMADSGLLEALRTGTNLPLYVHTINDPEIAYCLMARGASGIYSDDLSQSDVSNLSGSVADCS